MKKVLLITNVLFVMSQNVQAASFFPGQVQVNVGPQLSCGAYNSTPYFRQIMGVQFNYTCRDVFTFVNYSYSQYVPCVFGCSLPAFNQQWIFGPAIFNCNLVAANCHFITSP